MSMAARSSDLGYARKRFEGGLIDFLEVLDAERTALTAELVYFQSRTDSDTSLVAVYKALGAGWDLQAPQ
jgi:outer membrane protein TolC